MSRMLSTTTMSRIWCRRTRSTISWWNRAGLLLRNSIEEPLSPQNVQWCFSPHQQPRAPSTTSCGSTQAAATDSSSRS